MRILRAAFFIFCLSGSLFAQDKVKINGYKFYVIFSTEKSEYSDVTMDTAMTLYRIENGKAKYLLTHNLFSFSADCNNEFKDIGTYTIQNDSIVFITEYWQKTGLDPIPERRKQIYSVGKEGKLTLVFDKVQQRSGEWMETN